MLSPVKTDRDWFVVTDPEIVKQLSAVPAVRVRRNQWQIHRSHLPVLSNVIEAQRLLSGVHTSIEEREALDRRASALGIKLRAAQYDAITFAGRRKGTLIGDEPRVGKTLSALMVHDPSTGPLIVICPLIARDVWLKWIRKVFPGEDIGVMVGRKFDRAIASKPIVVGHYEVVPHWRFVRPTGTVVFDEAHYLSNSDSKRHMMAALFADQAQRVIAATGTPIWDRPIDLYGVLGVVAPGAFGSKQVFGEKYCAGVPSAYGWVFDGVSYADELKSRLTEIMIRRRWSDVCKDLPPITRDVIVAKVTNAQAREIDFAVAEIKSGTAASLARFRRAVGSMKIAPTVEAAQMILDRGEPVVVWAWHKDVAKAIAERLNGLLITGDVPQAKRAQIFEDWNAHPCCALVLTLAVAQVGIDLSHARIAIFAEVDYVALMIAQAEMRTYDPTRAMHITYAVADHLIDRKLIGVLHSKLGTNVPLGTDVGGDAIDTLRTAINGESQAVDMAEVVRDLLSSDYEGE